MSQSAHLPIELFSGRLYNPFEFWQVEDISTWLSAIRFRHYQTNFRNHSICGRSLPMMEEEELRAIGIEVLGDRKAIMYEIKQLDRWTGYQFRYDVPTRVLLPTAQNPPATVEACAYLSPSRLLCVVIVTLGDGERRPATPYDGNFTIKWQFTPQDTEESLSKSSSARHSGRTTFSTTASYRDGQVTRSIIRMPCPCQSISATLVSVEN